MQERHIYRITGLLVILALASILLPIFIADRHKVLATHISQRAFVIPKTPSEWQQDKVPAVKANTAIAQNTQVAPKTWVLQLASFKDKQHADGLTATCRKQGFAAYTKNHQQTDSKIVYRVFVGPKASKQAADKLQQQLASAVHINGLVTQYQMEH